MEEMRKLKEELAAAQDLRKKKQTSASASAKTKAAPEV